MTHQRNDTMNNTSAKFETKEEKNGAKKLDKSDAEKDEDVNGQEKKPDHPVDHGYAWVVLVGGILAMALLIGIIKSSGLMFVAFQEKFKSSSSMTSLPSTVQNICYSVMALFVLNVGMKITTSRNLVIFGSILMCIAYVVTSQAQDVRVLMFSYGILHGIASAFMMPCTVVTVSQYFDKRRGFANSLAVSGSCIGGLIYAPLITNLLSTYGYEGCFLIIGGILLNGCVCGVLFRPLSFYSKRHSEKKHVKSHGTLPETEAFIPEVRENGKPLTLDKQKSVAKGNNRLLAKLGVDERLITSTKSLNHHFDREFDHVTRPRSQTIGEKERHLTPKLAVNDHEHYSSKEFMSSSLYDIPAFVVPTSKLLNDLNANNSKFIDVENPFNSRESHKVDSSDKNWLSTFVNLFDYGVFKEPVFVAFLLSASCTCPSTVMTTIYIAPLAKDVGVSTEKVAELVLVYTAVDLVFRVMLGYISDKGWVRRSTLIGTTTMIVSLSANLVRFYSSYNILIVFAVILGLVSGLYFSIYPVVITDYMSLGRLHSCLGFTALVHGFAVAGTFFVVGYLRDISGSYVVPYHFIGIQAFIGGFFMLTLPFAERYQNSRRKRKTVS